ncbi:Uncharacterised protein [Legionella beliardensis]|uniref:F-box domain-containing protein n=1 Tax=Legionella beliardensis TaxID=91822 RepID=A0A378I2C3_9GAMM|nr:hypothetical protein [Legionella beliardensis]STX29318.1 Uncharacterised protein [Legionella beliardensis]
MKPSNRISPLTTLPPELKSQIALFLTINDWFSLRLADSAWKSIVTSAATLYLTSMEQRLPQLIASNFDFDLLLQKLLEEFKSLRERFEGKGVKRAEKRLEEMNDVIKNLQDPIAKFLFLKEQLSEQLADSSQQLFKESNATHSFLFRSGFMQSFHQRFKEIIQPIFDNCTNFSESLGFKKMLICIKLCSEHPLAQRWAQATLQVKEQKASMSPAQTNEENISSLKEVQRERERREAQRWEGLRLPTSVSFFSIPKLEISFPPSSESKPNRNMKRNP